MGDDNRILIGVSDKPVYLETRYANRHGLITGATGTGKTVTLQVLAEGFSRLGVPVLLADVKGDMSGICEPGGGNPKFEERAAALGIGPLEYASSPVVFWDLFGEQGHPVRTTISEMGPLLLSRLLGLNETQEGVLNAAFKMADDEGFLLLDMKDLRATLQFMAENASQLSALYGNITSASVGAIQRALLVLEQQGGDGFFGEPALEIESLIRTAPDGRGVVNILAADRLMQNPRLYSTFLLWLLSELFEDLPEVGDLEKPRMVFVFDEAHLLFDEAPVSLVQRIEQVVRLVRSKGVGIFFVSQSPLDIPDSVLSQMGNRIQHALRAYTPREQQAVKTAADTFRPNPAFNTADVITQLGVGEALVSVLQDKGTPSVVERTMIRPPVSHVGPCAPESRRSVISQSPFAGQFDRVVDRESAFELLGQRALQRAAEEQAQADAAARAKMERTQRTRRSDDPLEAFAKSMARSVGSQLGRQIIRGVLGGMFGGRRR
jgi:DNA helicase HerA-like ATPase